MKKLNISTLTFLKAVPYGMCVALLACSNPMPCPGEMGAPMDQGGNEVDASHNSNREQRLNTDCYYGRGDNGKIALLMQKPQTGFWNSSLYRTDQQAPMNSKEMDNTVASTELESLITSSTVPASADPSQSAPAPSAASPLDRPLYYRAGKVKSKCGGTMNVYKEAHVPPCPASIPTPIQRTYVQNYPPVAVQTGEAPAQATGAFLGGIGEDVIGAGALTYAIRYRPDRISNNSTSAGSTSNSVASSGSQADPRRFTPQRRGPAFQNRDSRGFRDGARKDDSDAFKTSHEGQGDLTTMLEK